MPGYTLAQNASASDPHCGCQRALRRDLSSFSCDDDDDVDNDNKELSTVLERFL